MVSPICRFCTGTRLPFAIVISVPKATLPPPPPQLAEVTVTGMVINWERVLKVPVTATLYDPVEEQISNMLRVTEPDPPDVIVTSIESVLLVQLRLWKHGTRLLVCGDCTADNVTVPLKPPILATVIVEMPDPP